MRLSVITDEISQDFEHALDVMLEYGVIGAELRGLWGVNIADLTDAHVDRALEALRSREMNVVGLATPFYKCDLPLDAADDSESETASGPLHLARPRDPAHQMVMLRRCIDLAHRFETDLLRVFAFWRKAALTPQIEDRIVEAFTAPIELARQEGVKLVLENEHACFIGSGAETARIMSRISSPHFRVCWDPGNAFSLGENPFPDGYEAVKPWVEHVHVKDARMVDTPDHGKQVQWCIIGEGEIDYTGQLSALKRDNYAGYISLETHFVPPTGSGPEGKGTPEDSSRACLAHLQNAIQF